jgi:hypothetical protein
MPRFERIAMFLNALRKRCCSIGQRRALVSNILDMRPQASETNQKVRNECALCIPSKLASLIFCSFFCSLAIEQLPLSACCLTETSSSSLSTSPTSDAAAIDEKQAANALASGVLSNVSSEKFTVPKQERSDREDRVAIVSGAIRNSFFISAFFLFILIFLSLPPSFSQSSTLNVCLCLTL